MTSPGPALKAFAAGLVLGAGFVVWVFRDYDLEDAAYSLGWRDGKEGRGYG